MPIFSLIWLNPGLSTFLKKVRMAYIHEVLPTDHDPHEATIRSVEDVTQHIADLLFTD